MSEERSWVASTPRPNASHSGGLGPRSLCLAKGFSGAHSPPAGPYQILLPTCTSTQGTTYKDQLTRFPTMSSTILSWREDISERTKAEGNKKLPQKFRLPLSEDLESGSCKRVCTWHRFAPQEHVSAGHCSGPHRFEESIAKQRLNIYIKDPAHHLRISLRMFICL